MRKNFQIKLDPKAHAHRLPAVLAVLIYPLQRGKIQEDVSALGGAGVTRIITSGSSHLNVRVTPSEAVYFLEVGGGFI